jgi:hypothetical protein
MGRKVWRRELLDPVAANGLVMRVIRPSTNLLLPLMIDRTPGFSILSILTAE